MGNLQVAANSIRRGLILKTINESAPLGASIEVVKSVLLQHGHKLDRAETLKQCQYLEDIRYKGGKRKPPKISWQRLIRSGFEAVCGKEDSGTQSICNLKTGNGVTISELLSFLYRNTPRRYKTIIA